MVLQEDWLISWEGGVELQGQQIKIRVGLISKFPQVCHTLPGCFRLFTLMIVKQVECYFSNQNHKKLTTLVMLYLKQFTNFFF